MAVAIGGWSCAVDNRSPKEVVAPEMTTGDSSDSARFSKLPNGGAAGSDAGAQTGGAAGGGPTGSAGMGSGGSDSGTAGAASGGSAGSGMTGNNAGATGMTPPPGAGGAPPGDLPDDPFGGLGDFGDQGGATSTGSSNNSTCPGFDPCGGALDGTWTYGNVCIDPSENSADLLQQVCPTASVMYERGGASTLTFTGNSVSRTGEPVGDSVITFPAECVEGLGCSFLAGALGTNADCMDLGGDCICRTASSVDWGTQSYTTMGGSLTLGNGRSFDYCVQGNTLTYRETGDVQEAGTHTLQRN